MYGIPDLGPHNPVFQLYWIEPYFTTMILSIFCLFFNDFVILFNYILPLIESFIEADTIPVINKIFLNEKNEVEAGMNLRKTVVKR